MPRRVLVVSYFFPPVGGVGVFRTLKYVKFLPRWGWQPSVVAPRDPAYGLRDPSLLDSIPAGIAVHRTLSLEPSRLPVAVRRRLRRGASDASAGAAPIAAPGVSPRTPLPSPLPASRAGALRWATSTWARAWDLALFPDQAIAWLPSALLVGRREIARHRIDVVYSSSPPVSGHVIAGLLARLARRPWVADFRDPWIGNAFAPELPSFKRPWQRALERWIVGRADRIIVTNQTIASAFAQRYPDAAARVRVIPNGYDREDLPTPPQVDAERGRLARPGRFRFAYGGSIYGERELQVFLEGLELLLDRRPELRARLDIEFVGRINEANQRLAAAYATPERLGNVVRFTGFIPHDEALLRIASADALLQLLADEPGKEVFVGAKLFEYVGLDLPILAVTPEGEARAMLRELRRGVLADPTPEGVADGIEAILATHAETAPSDPEGRYDRVNLARRLAEVFDEVVAESGRGDGSAGGQPVSPDRL